MANPTEREVAPLYEVHQRVKSHCRRQIAVTNRAWEYPGPADHKLDTGREAIGSETILRSWKERLGANRSEAEDQHRKYAER